MADRTIEGTIILPDRVIDRGWLLISDGAIHAIGEGSPPSGDPLCAAGGIVVPGAIDSQVHSRSQADREDFRWSTSSAAAGGVTTIVDMPYDDGRLISSAERFEAKKAEAAEQARVDFALYATVDPAEGCARINELVEAGACGFKFSTFGTDPKRFPRLSPYILYDCFSAIAPHDLIAGIHNEDDETVRAYTIAVDASGDTSWLAHGRSRPPITEALAMAQVYEIGAATRCPVHVVHCSIGRGYDLAAGYRDQGVRATVEACLHYLILDEDKDVRRLGGFAKVNPPIRSRVEREALWRHLLAGNIEVVSTDHVSWSRDRKQNPDIRKNASGVPALEVLYPLLLTGLRHRGMALTHAARVLAENPARLFRLDGKKGALTLGLDADLAVFRPESYRYDPKASGANVADWSPYTGMKLDYRLDTTVLRGTPVFQDGKVIAAEGFGQFVPPCRCGAKA